MTRFSFQAVDDANQAVTGTIDADDKRSAFGLLRSRGLFPLVVEVDNSIGRILNTDLSRKTVSKSALYRLLIDLGHLVSAGVEVPTALALIERTGTNVDQELTRTLSSRIRRGDPLSDALKDMSASLPSHVIAIIRAGEVSNSLGESMIKVAEDARKAHALRTRILTALIYPSAVALATFGATIVLLAVVVPALEDLFSGQMDRLPWQTRALVSLSNILRDHYLALSTSSCLAIVIGAGAFRNDLIRRMFERAALKAPVLGPLLESIETVQIATLLATLTHARIPLVTALELLKGGARLKISRSSLSESVASLREGQRLHEALKSVDALSARILDLVQVGELTGKLPELLDEAARDAERRVNASIDRGLAMLTPIMTLLFGGIAGFVLYSVMTAVMSVNSLVEN